MQKGVQGFGVKSWTVFWCKKLCKVLMERAAKGYSLKSCAEFWCKKLYRNFFSKSFAWFWCKKGFRFHLINTHTQKKKRFLLLKGAQGQKHCAAILVQKAAQCFWCKNYAVFLCKKTVQDFGVKSCVMFWCKKVCSFFFFLCKKLHRVSV